jgi:hypothetical protein
MKTLTYLLFFSLLLSFHEAKSSHYGGANIDVAILSNDRAAVEITVYRTIDGSTLVTSVYDVDNLSDTLPKFSRTGTIVSRRIMQNLWGKGFEKVIIRDTVFLTSSGLYSFSLTWNARPPGANGAGQYNLHVFHEVQHVMGTTNSGLHFSSDALFTSKSEDCSISSLAFHEEADSVVHILGTPMISSNTTIGGYQPFFSSTLNPMNIDPVLNRVTGLLKTSGFNPSTGYYTYVVDAIAYKDGQILSSSRRDVVYLPNQGIQPLLPGFTAPPTNFTTLAGGDGYRVKVGDTLRLDSIICNHFNTSAPGNGVKRIEHYTTPGIKLGQNASLTIAASNALFTNYSFSYVPDSAENNSYQVLNFRLNDSVEAYDYAFWIYVDGDTTVQQIGADMRVEVNSVQEAHVQVGLYHEAHQVLPQTKEVLLMPQGGGAPIPMQLNKDTVETISLRPSAILRTAYSGSSPVLAAGSYKVVLEECCRTSQADNYAKAANHPFYTEATFVVGGSVSGTPGFTQNPITAIAKDSLWLYNINTTDLDGDSVYYSFTDVLSGPAMPVSGFSTIPGTANHGSIDQAAGILFLKPGTLGTYAYNVKAEAFRGGSLVETVNREMLLEVLDSSSLVLQPAVPNSVSSSGLPSFSLTGGQLFTLDLIGYTLLVSDSTTGISMEADGVPFDLPSSNATFVVTNNKQGSGKKGTFSWTPDKRLKGQSFVITIRVSDGQMTYDYAAVLHVDQAVSIHEHKRNTVAVYPNPTKGMLNLVFSKEGNYNVSLVNLSGQTLLKQELEVVSGTAHLELPNSITAGVYFLEIEEAGFKESVLVQVGR